MHQVIFLIIFVTAFQISLISTTDFLIHGVRKHRSMSQVRTMKLAKDYLVAFSVDVDKDGNNELLLHGEGQTLPLSILEIIKSVTNEGYASNIVYCTGPPNTSDAMYATNSDNYSPPAPIGLLISPGNNGSFETSCNDFIAKDDDILLSITLSEIQSSPSEIGGGVNIVGYGSRAINLKDNVNFQGSLVSIGNFATLPTVDPYNRPIKTGTLAYVYGPSKQFAVFTGTNWKIFNLR